MLWEETFMKKICLLLVFCLCLSACSAFAEKTADAAALIEQARTALENGDYEGMISRLGNSLEEISLQLVEEIRDVKEQLTELGFDGVLMSGSGSTVFGITKSPRLLRESSDLMRANGYFVRMTRIIQP